MILTKNQLRWARIKIRRHYGLGRPVTDEEVRLEVANIQRRERDGLGLDDSLQALKSSLATGHGPIEFCTCHWCDTCSGMFICARCKRCTRESNHEPNCKGCPV